VLVGPALLLGGAGICHEVRGSRTTTGMSRSVRLW
jgi:hypothetical protein